MKKQLLFFVLLLGNGAFAQETPFQPFEVDSAAQPRGGMACLNTFLRANLRKLVKAEAKGLGGRVIVSAIVETDGRVTDVKSVRNDAPELSREAVRVFTLFNAWQPAQKGGKAVRQQVSVPVTFVANPSFTYADGAVVNYFDADKKPVAEGSDQIRYKQVAPMDTNGLPTGDIVLYKAKGTNWKEDFRLPLIRQKSAENSTTARTVYTLGYQNEDKQWQGNVFSVDENRVLVSQAHYENGRRNGLAFTYYPNGLVKERSDEADGKRAITAWYPNGQIRQIYQINPPRPMAASVNEQVTALWDSSGRQLIQDGTGRAVYTHVQKSYSDSTRQTRYLEQGAYVNSFRQGIWTGRCEDGSYFYEEEYDKGICQRGKAVTAGGDTVRYTAMLEQPEFEGGMPGLGKFLAQNLRYPIDAQRNRQQGLVFVSFVVCTDGTLCDYEVVKSVAPALDQEALRVIKAMSGRWKPGTQRGQKVRVKYNMPIAFTLQ